MLPLLASLALAATPHTFAAGPNSWLLDGQPFQIRSGEMHYPRVPRAYWMDRFKRLRALGCNAVTTYVFWNLHEPEPGKFDFSGNNDVAEYVREAQKAGLYVILRPGPYVCSEWDWGGFPYWLANIPNMAVRQNNPAFLKASGEYLDRLGKELAPLTVAHGGPIILCQVENEYGSFGHDHEYMQAIHDEIKHAGFDCQMYTADGSSQDMLSGGTLPDLPAAINFGGGPEGEFANLAKFRPSGPRMNGEFWCGWFDHWGEQHHVTGAEGQAQDLEWMLSRGYSVSLYMGHGGTSFGWMAGANSGGRGGYEPDTSSYDYDAPIGEDGRLTPKFWAFRKVMAKHLNPGETLPDPPAAIPHIAVKNIVLDQLADLMSQLPRPIRSDHPLSFEELHHPYGLVVYSAAGSTDDLNSLKLQNLQDRAWAESGAGAGIYFDRASRSQSPMPALSPSGGPRLHVVVAELGRVNFSRALLGEHKGISGATLDGNALTDWMNQPVDLDHLDRLKYAHAHEVPSPSTDSLFIVRRGTFNLDATGDTFFRVPGPEQPSQSKGECGVVWVNGHNLGRWDAAGPQRTLYCPKAWLKAGTNSIYVLDCGAASNTSWVVSAQEDPFFSTTEN
jgi:beta-galactosidase